MVAKPSMRFSNKGSTASGVTSRPVNPVPPVVMTTSIDLSAIQPLNARADRLHLVLDDRPFGDSVTSRANAFDQGRTGRVVVVFARIGDRQHRNLQRHELTALVDAGHRGLATPGR